MINNPLPTLCKVLTTEWDDAIRVCPVILYHLKRVGVGFETDDAFAVALSLLTELGFIQLQEGKVRLNPYYKEVYGNT